MANEREARTGFLYGKLNSKAFAILIGTVIGILIGQFLAGTHPEVIVLLTGLIVVPFFLVDAVYNIFGQEKLFLALGAMAGALIGVIEGSVDPDPLLPIAQWLTDALRGSAIGAGLIALTQTIYRSIQNRA